MEEVEIIDRSVAEMLIAPIAGLNDRFGVIALTESKRQALYNNPYVTNLDSHCQLIGVVNGIAIGGEIHFPLYWTISGKPVGVLCSSTTFVAKEYRKTELGLQLKEYRKLLCPSDITCGSGCSQMMLKVLRYWKEPIFLMPRMIMLFKSRSVIDMKLRGWMSRFTSAIIDVGLLIYWWSVKRIIGFKLRGCTFDTVDSENDNTLESVAELISSDKHPYAELHDVRWLKWHLTESFTNDGPMKLTAVKRNGRLIAFYMTKVRFYAQASARGFKNVRLVSLMEWQAIKGEEGLLPWILLHASCAHTKTNDAVEIVTVDAKILKRLRLLGWQHVGDSNFTFHIHDGPLKGDDEIYNDENWRLRPAMGDVGLS